MNLYDFSKENNYELGYYFHTRQTSKSFKETVIDNDILLSNPEILRGRYFNNQEDTNQENARIRGGFCIHCRCELPLNPSRPLCYSCYRNRPYWDDYNYAENFCHICGKEISSHNRYDSISFSNPVCNNCRNRYVTGFNTKEGNHCSLNVPL